MIPVNFENMIINRKVEFCRKAVKFQFGIARNLLAPFFVFTACIN